MRRIIFCLIVGVVLALPLLGACANPAALTTSASFPERTITFIVPTAAGGGHDLPARAITSCMPKYLPGKGAIIVENMDDPAGDAGPLAVYTAKPDGYTIMDVMVDAYLTRQILTPRKWDLRELTWLGQLTVTNHALAVSAKSQFKTVEDLAKQKRVRWASRIGSVNYCESVIVSKELGLDSTYIGYKGLAELPVALMRGDADAAMVNIESVLSFIKEGDLRLLCTTTTERVGIVGEVPSALEVGLGKAAELTGGQARLSVCGPPKMPKDIASLLSDALYKSTQDKDMIKWGESTEIRWTWASPEDVSKAVAESYPRLLEYKDLLK